MPSVLIWTRFKSLAPAEVAEQVGHSPDVVGGQVGENRLRQVGAALGDPDLAGEAVGFARDHSIDLWDIDDILDLAAGRKQEV